MRSKCLTILALSLALTLTTRAQFTANNQTNTISGVASNWVGNGTYVVGSNTFRDALQVINGGALSNGTGFIGYEVSGSNNSVLVTGPGSVWSNALFLVVGSYGAGNSLVISNQGAVFDGTAYVGAIGGNNSVLVTGPGSVWSNYQVVVGYAGGGASNSLVISNQGAVVSDNVYVGDQPGGSNNSVLVTGPGSVWSNSSYLHVGSDSAGNSLLINNQGAVVTYYGYVGGSYGSSNNSVLVTGPGSVWSNYQVVVGYAGVGNSLVISNQGAVVSYYCDVGYGGYSSNNSVRVADGAVWRNGVLHVGNQGSSNSLAVAGGTVLATNLIVGVASVDCNNLVQLDSGSVFITNATGNAVFEVRYGKLMLNGGTLRVDRFVMTNACAQFVRTGGTLIYGSAVLDPNQSAVGDGIPNGWKQQYGLDPFDPNLASADTDGDGRNNLQEYLAGTDPTNSASAFRIIEIAPDDGDMLIAWTAVGGKRYALQTTTGHNGSFSNDFVDLNPAIAVLGTGETEVAVLHLGAATNAPARYYRVRLVP